MAARKESTPVTGKPPAGPPPAPSEPPAPPQPPTPPAPPAEPPASSEQSTGAAAGTETGAKSGRKPWIKKTPVEHVLDQIGKQEEKVAGMREELKKEEEALTKLQQAKKLLEGT